MNNPFPDPDLVKVTEIFLVPSSFLVAALGTADTNMHRAAISLIGLIVSVLWLVCSREALGELFKARTGDNSAAHPRRTLILSWLATVFVIGWLVSTVFHSLYWNHPLGS